MSWTRVCFHAQYVCSGKYVHQGGGVQSTGFRGLRNEAGDVCRV